MPPEFCITSRLADGHEPDRMSFPRRGACRPVRGCGFGRPSESAPIMPEALAAEPLLCKVLGRAGAQDARKLFLLTLYFLFHFMRLFAFTANPLMYVDYTATAFTFPFFTFSPFKFFNSIFPNIIQVFYHAHFVPGSISFVHVSYQNAWILRTLMAVFKSLRNQGCAILNFAFHSCFRVPCVYCSTPIALVLFSQVCHADAAVHAAWSYEIHFFIHQLTSRKQKQYQPGC